MAGHVEKLWRKHPQTWILDGWSLNFYWSMDSCCVLKPVFWGAMIFGLWGLHRVIVWILDCLLTMFCSNPKRRRISNRTANKCSFDGWDDGERGFRHHEMTLESRSLELNPFENVSQFMGLITHRIHGTGIFTYIWLKFGGKCSR